MIAPVSSVGRRLVALVRGRPRDAAIAGGVLLLVFVVALVLVLTGGPDDDHPSVRAEAVPYDGRSPRLPSGDEVRVLVRFARPSLGQKAAQRARAGLTPLTARSQRLYVRSLQRETAKTRSALQARGIALSDVVSFERTVNGFAATARTRDLAALNTLGIRAQPVRRFFPALTDPLGARKAPAEPAGQAPPAEQSPIALLGSGVALGNPQLRERVEPGRDAVDRDDDPSPGVDPRLRSRTERDGTALAGVLAAAGERVRAFRVAGLRTAADGGGAEEYGTTDELLAALERVVDPDGNGDTEDALAIALVAVSSPYAGFTGTPEAVAADGAAALGTLVIAPAGEEGPAAGPHGVLGSPGAAPAVLGVGAAVGPASRIARTRLTLGDDLRVNDAALLGGPKPSGTLGETARPVSGSDPRELLDKGLSGRVAIVRAGGGDAAAAAGATDARGGEAAAGGADQAANPAAQAQAAAAAGAKAVVIADPRPGAALPALSAGRVGVPVLGVTGEAAEAALELPAGQKVEVEGGSPPALGEADGLVPDRGDDDPGAARDPSQARTLGALRLAGASSRGPALNGAPKPDLAAPALALAPTPEGEQGLVAGSAVAAARAAVAAAALLRNEPDLPPSQAIARLRAAAVPGRALPSSGTGAGVLDPARVGAPTLAASPPSLALGGLPAARAWTRTRVIPIANPTAAPQRVAIATEAVGGVSATVAPAAFELGPGKQRDVTLTLRGPASPPAGFASGRVTVSAGGRPALSLPWQAALGQPDPAHAGDVRLVRRKKRVEGVRFALGRFRRGDPAGGAATRIDPVQRLELTLENASDGSLVRRLTPPGGAPELLPAVYEYRLARKDLKELAPGSYRFRLRAWAPRRSAPTDVRSPAFSSP